MMAISGYFITFFWLSILPTTSFTKQRPKKDSPYQRRSESIDYCNPLITVSHHVPSELSLEDEFDYCNPPITVLHHVPSEFSLEDEFLSLGSFSSAIKQTPGRPSTPRNEVKTHCYLGFGQLLPPVGGGVGIGGVWLFHDKIYLIPHKAL